MAYAKDINFFRFETSGAWVFKELIEDSDTYSSVVEAFQKHLEQWRKADWIDFEHLFFLARAITKLIGLYRTKDFFEKSMISTSDELRDIVWQGFNEQKKALERKDSGTSTGKKEERTFRQLIKNANARLLEFENAKELEIVADELFEWGVGAFHDLAGMATDNPSVREIGFRLMVLFNKARPDDLRVWRTWTRVLAYAKNHRAAEIAATEGVRRFPSFAPLYASLLFSRRRISGSLDRMTRAIAINSLNKFPFEPTVYEQYCSILSRSKSHTDQSRALYISLERLRIATTLRYEANLAAYCYFKHHEGMSATNESVRHIASILSNTGSDTRIVDLFWCLCNFYGAGDAAMDLFKALGDEDPDLVCRIGPVVLESVVDLDEPSYLDEAIEFLNNCLGDAQLDIRVSLKIAILKFTNRRVTVHGLISEEQEKESDGDEPTLSFDDVVIASDDVLIAKYVDALLYSAKAADWTVATELISGSPAIESLLEEETGVRFSAEMASGSGWAQARKRSNRLSRHDTLSPISDDDESFDEDVHGAMPVYVSSVIESIEKEVADAVRFELSLECGDASAEDMMNWTAGLRDLLRISRRTQFVEIVAQKFGIYEFKHGVYVPLEFAFFVAARRGNVDLVKELEQNFASREWLTTLILAVLGSKEANAALKKLLLYFPTSFADDVAIDLFFVRNTATDIVLLNDSYLGKKGVGEFVPAAELLDRTSQILRASHLSACGYLQ